MRTQYKQFRNSSRARLARAVFALRLVPEEFLRGGDSPQECPMIVSFPTMRGQIGQREYFACLMKLGDIPGMFTFKDWIEFTPEDREQRVLNKKRVPEMAKYIIDNEDGYLFASITASYKSSVNFTPLDGPDGSLGTLSMELGTANFVINDGQHRCAAIARAIKMNPALAHESISVLLFPCCARAIFRAMRRFSARSAASARS